MSIICALYHILHTNNVTDITNIDRKLLERENKKFVFLAVKKGARGRAYENALTWLEDAGLIYRANAVASAKQPLRHYADTGCFKVYALDVGLLGAIAKSPVEL